MISVKNILVPTDFSEHSEKAIRYGVELATNFGADLHLLHAVETTPIMYGEGAAYLPPEATAEIEAAAAKQLDELNDLDDGLLLKNAAVLGARQIPKPRDDFRSVGTPPLDVLVAGAEPTHLAVEKPRRIVGTLYAESHVGADDSRGIDLRLVRDELQIVAKQSGQLLLTLKGGENQGIVSQRGGEPQPPRFLFQRHRGFS